MNKLSEMYHNGQLNGWVGPEIAKKYWNLLKDNFHDFSESAAASSDIPKSFSLHNVARKVLGHDVPLIDQLNIGSCVGAGGSSCLNYLQVADMLMRGVREQFKKTYIPWLYGISRVYVLGDMGCNDDGSSGSALSEAVRKFGVLVEDDEDTPEYSVEVCRDWGCRKEILDKHLPLAKNRLVKSTAKIGSFSELKQSLANGFPCTIACSILYGSEPDSKGFHRRSGSGGHQTCFYGYGVSPSGDEYALIANSWNDVLGHLKDFDNPSEYIPYGTWRIHASDAEDMISSEGECFAYSQYDNGFPNQDISKELFKLG